MEPATDLPKHPSNHRPFIHARHRKKEDNKRWVAPISGRQKIGWHQLKATQATEDTQSPKKSRTTQNTQTSNRKKVGGTD